MSGGGTMVGGINKERLIGNSHWWRRGDNHFFGTSGIKSAARGGMGYHSWWYIYL